jgi:hypothetical protein
MNIGGILHSAAYLKIRNPLTQRSQRFSQRSQRAKLCGFNFVYLVAFLTTEALEKVVFVSFAVIKNFYSFVIPFVSF